MLWFHTPYLLRYLTVHGHYAQSRVVRREKKRREGARGRGEERYIGEERGELFPLHLSLSFSLKNADSQKYVHVHVGYAGAPSARVLLPFLEIPLQYAVHFFYCTSLYIVSHTIGLRKQEIFSIFWKSSFFITHGISESTVHTQMPPPRTIRHHSYLILACSAYCRQKYAMYCTMYVLLIQYTLRVLAIVK